MKNTLFFTIVFCIALVPLTAQENYLIAGDTTGVWYNDIDPDILLDPIWGPMGSGDSHDIDINSDGLVDFTIEVYYYEGTYCNEHQTKVVSHSNNKVGYSYITSPEGFYMGLGREQGDTINEDILFTQQPVYLFYKNLGWGCNTQYTWNGGNDYIPVCLIVQGSSECMYGWIKVYDATYAEITLDSYTVDISNSCLPEGITFETQAQIDNFPTDYPYCTEIEGDVFIYGNDITNLNGLNVLNSVGGSLVISNTNALKSLTGLNNLISIGGDFTLGTGSTGPALITDLSGIGSLQNIGGRFSATGCASLTSLAGLEGITELKGIGLENIPLINLEGLENLANINGDVGIYDNVKLRNLEGLNKLTSITGDLSIGRLYPMLAPNGNPSLKSLTGINNLTSIGGNLEVMGNDSLVDFTGLDNLHSIGGSVDIFHNNSLISIEQLNNLTSINGRIKIGYDYWNEPYGNVSLVSLAGLDNIQYGTVTEIDIAWNYSLSDCEANTICDYLANLTTGSISIHNNAEGCNSPEEVQDSCEEPGGYPDMDLSKDDIFIYPNPASKELNIIVEGFFINEVTIYTLTGQKVYALRPKGKTINISTLQPGMYIVEVTVENRKIRQKLLVK